MVNMVMSPSSSLESKNKWWKTPRVDERRKIKKVWWWRGSVMVYRKGSQVRLGQHLRKEARGNHYER